MARALAGAGGCVAQMRFPKGLFFQKKPFFFSKFGKKYRVCCPILKEILHLLSKCISIAFEHGCQTNRISEAAHMFQILEIQIDYKNWNQ